jgi:hypothetical protein
MPVGLDSTLGVLRSLLLHRTTLIITDSGKQVWHGEDPRGSS